MTGVVYKCKQNIILYVIINYINYYNVLTSSSLAGAVVGRSFASFSVEADSLVVALCLFTITRSEDGRSLTVICGLRGLRSECGWIMADRANWELSSPC